MSDPTADEIARWAELTMAAMPGPWVNYERAVYEDRGILHRVARTDMLADAEFIAAARTAVPRLLALVAAQAEQIARLESAFSHTAAEWRERDAARAELAALHATDDYQRWARAVAERGAAREQVARVRALHTPNDPPSSTYAKECMGCDGYWPCETARALDGGAAT